MPAETPNIIHAIVLGIIQGVTEFLPVSSSGHLVILPWLFGWAPSGLLFDTMLHWGTLLSIIAVFWRDFLTIMEAMLQSIRRRTLEDPDARIGWLIVIGTIPAAVTGLLLKDSIENLFSSPRAAGAFLLVTALLLAASEYIVRRRAERDLQHNTLVTHLTLSSGIWIGFAQALALAPGISRSGSTIAAGLATGLRRDEAARFSFLLGTPVFFAAGLLQLLDTMAESQTAVIAQAPGLVAGFASSAVVGYIAIRGLLSYLRTNSLYIFIIYCLLAGLVTIALTVVWA